MNNNQLQGIFALLGAMLAGVIVQHGIMSQSQANDFVGGLVALLMFGWTVWHHSASGPGPATGAKVAAPASTVTLLFLVALLPLCGLLTACGTLATGGAYAGNTALYQADSTVWTSYQAIDAALKWETANDATVSPSVRAAANTLRVQAPKAFSSYAALRAAYLANQTAGSQASLQAAVTDIVALATAISNWLPGATTAASASLTPIISLPSKTS